MKAFVVKAPFAPLIALGIKTIETKPGPPAGDMKPEGVRPASGCAINRGERVAIVIGKTSYSYDEYPEAWDVLARALAAGMGAAPSGESWARWFRRNEGPPAYPLGSIICTAIVGDALPIVEHAAGIDSPHPTLGEADHIGPDHKYASGDLMMLTGWYGYGWYGDSIQDQLPLGEYTPGRWGWMLQDVQTCDPIPCGRAQGVKNHQGVFQLPPAITGEAQ